MTGIIEQINSKPKVVSVLNLPHSAIIPLCQLISSDLNPHNTKPEHSKFIYLRHVKQQNAHILN